LEAVWWPDELKRATRRRSSRSQSDPISQCLVLDECRIAQDWTSPVRPRTRNILAVNVPTSLSRKGIWNSCLVSWTISRGRRLSLPSKPASRRDYETTVRIPNLALDVFPDHARSCSAGNIRRFGGSTSSQITLKSPKWALSGHWNSVRSRASPPCGRLRRRMVTPAVCEIDPLLV
jgi:hypothetical protein